MKMAGKIFRESSRKSDPKFVKLFARPRYSMEIRKRFPQTRRPIVVMDNERALAVPGVRRVFRQHKIAVVRLPPRCPDMAPPDFWTHRCFRSWRLQHFRAKGDKTRESEKEGLARLARWCRKMKWVDTVRQTRKRWANIVLQKGWEVPNK